MDEEYKRQGMVFIGKTQTWEKFTEAGASPTCQRVGSAPGALLCFSQVLGVGCYKYLTLLNPQLYFTLNLNINQSKVYQLK